MLQPNAQPHSLITRKINGLSTSELRAVLVSRHYMLAARKVVDTLPEQPLYIHVSGVSGRQIFLSKRKLVAQYGTSADGIHVLDLNNQKVSPMETLDVSNNPSNVSAAVQSSVSTVHYKRT